MGDLACTYRRAPDVLWRDTGRHVLVAVPHQLDVHVLGGGGAAIWRHLARGASVDELVARFAGQGSEPAVSALTDHLQVLRDLEILVIDKGIEDQA